MSDPIDITAETDAICQKLGLETNRVVELHWWPDRMKARVYRVNEKGKIIFDQSSNAVLQDEIDFEVRA